MRRHLVLFIVGSLVCVSAVAQQTGSVSGTVSLEDGAPIPGALITATSDVLPQARTTVSNASGDYRLRLLPPGNYVLTFTMDGMGEQVVAGPVLLDQNSTIDVTMGPELSETIEVTSTAALIDTSSSELKSAIAEEVIDALPVGQQYQDIVKLIPGVQYTEDEIRGPSAGGSGQDNVYLFDGVNVGLRRCSAPSLPSPPRTTSSRSPSSRAAPRPSTSTAPAASLINTVSKSGTNRFRGMLSYQLQSDSMTGSLDTGSSGGVRRGPGLDGVQHRRPGNAGQAVLLRLLLPAHESRDNVANAYGEVPDFEDERDELFGKLTFTPTGKLLSPRQLPDSERDADRPTGWASSKRARARSGGDFTQDIGTVEGTWVAQPQELPHLQVYRLHQPGSSRPDTLFDFPINANGPGGTTLDVDNLDQQGEFGGADGGELRR